VIEAETPLPDAEFQRRLQPAYVDAWRREHGLPAIDRGAAVDHRAEPRGFILPAFDANRCLGVGPHC
jgi:hypothetical protein